jgi:hypothetical protein
MFSYFLILVLMVACSSLEPITTINAQPETELQPTVKEIKSDLAGCQVDPHQRQDVAILPDAKIESATANFITYQTASGVEDVVKFYQSEMVQQGWAANEGNVFESDRANLVYNKADEVAMLIIHQQVEGKTTVVITINNAKARPGCGKAGS